MLGGPGIGVLTVAREFPSVTLPWINQGSPVTFLEPAEDGAIDLDGAARAEQLSVEQFCALARALAAQRSAGVTPPAARRRSD